VLLKEQPTTQLEYLVVRIACNKIANISSEVLEAQLHYSGLNPYKAVEMYQKYRPVVPDEFHSDELYASQVLRCIRK
jgi:hypothetical protein